MQAVRVGFAHGHGVRRNRRRWVHLDVGLASRRCATATPPPTSTTANDVAIAPKIARRRTSRWRPRPTTRCQHRRIRFGRRRSRRQSQESIRSAHVASSSAPNATRSAASPRDAWVFTVPTEHPSVAATVASLRSATYRSTTTSRSSPWQPVERPRQVDPFWRPTKSPPSPPMHAGRAAICASRQSRGCRSRARPMASRRPCDSASSSRCTPVRTLPARSRRHPHGSSSAGTRPDTWRGTDRETGPRTSEAIERASASTASASPTPTTPVTRISRPSTPKG